MTSAPKLPTEKWPTQIGAYYVNILYRTWFFGPFASLDDVRAATAALDAHDPLWDYDCVACFRLAQPISTMTDPGLLTVSEEWNVKAKP